MTCKPNAGLGKGLKADIGVKNLGITELACNIWDLQLVDRHEDRLRATGQLLSGLLSCFSRQRAHLGFKRP